MGLGMFTKGRMGILPHNIKDRKALKEMFRKIEDGTAGRTINDYPLLLSRLFNEDIEQILRDVS